MRLPIKIFLPPISSYSESYLEKNSFNSILGPVNKDLEKKISEVNAKSVDLTTDDQINNLIISSVSALTSLDLGLDKSDENNISIEKLKVMKPNELKALGQKLDKTDFFKALLPAALEGEKLYGVPASVTLAQASLESAWARSPIGGYNIFGITGKGPSGESVNVKTREVINGKNVYMKRNFAKFNNFFEAITEHGKVFTNKKFSNYTKATSQFKKDGDDLKFLKTVSSTYATDPKYEWAIKKRIETYGLLEMVNEARNK